MEQTGLFFDGNSLSLESDSSEMSARVNTRAIYIGCYARPPIEMFPDWNARSDLGRNSAFARWFCATATVCFQLVPSDRHIKVEEAQFLFPRQTPRTSQSYIVDHIEDRHVTPKEH